jgi:hypothetical protein
MSQSTRHFLVTGDEIRPLPQKLHDQVRQHAVRLPRYAGRTLHLLDVTVELDRGKPKKVRGITPAVLPLDDDGWVASTLKKDLKAALRGEHREGPPWSPSKVMVDRATRLALSQTRSRLRPPLSAAETKPGRKRR